MMGRWSDAKEWMVFQVVRACRLEEIDVISGEVGCWLGVNGWRVGVLSLRMR